MQMNFEKSKTLFGQAKQVIPGGVNSPARAFRSVGMDPFYVSHAKGSKIYDVDQHAYIDYVCSWGPLILGHAHDRILRTVSETVSCGTSFGACHEAEIKLAKAVAALYPSIDMVRMVNSGTEATMSALRLARGYTGRDKIIKFEGCFHGHADSFLIQAGSGLLTLGIPNSPGVTKTTAQNTLVASFNNIASVEKLVMQHKDDIAAIIMEPIMGNAGVILPEVGFLEEVRALTQQHNIVLIFDEVITGFRVAPGGAQQLYGVTPDLTCLGKILGGGFPVGAFGGKKEIMEHLAPAGAVYQAGTLSGNPVAMQVGVETLAILQAPDFYEKQEQKAVRMEKGLEAIRQQSKIPFTVNRVASMHTLFFNEQPVVDYATATASDTSIYARFFRGMLERGVFFAPSQFEAAFISEAHSNADIDKTLEGIEDCLKSL